MQEAERVPELVNGDALERLFDEVLVDELTALDRRELVVRVLGLEVLGQALNGGDAERWSVVFAEASAARGELSVDVVLHEAQLARVERA